MRTPWFVQQLVEVGSLDPELGEFITRLSGSDDTDEANQLAILIELEVAPPSVGLRPGVRGVVEAIIAGLPCMGESARWHALGLLNQVVGWLYYAKTDDYRDLIPILVGFLPSAAALAEYGDSDFRTQFVDFAANCAALDPSVAARVAFYLRRLVDEIGGTLGKSAQAELDELETP